jgi:hypothetical protein
MKLLMENWKKYLKESPDPGREPEGAGTLKYYRRRDEDYRGEIAIDEDSLQEEHKEDYWLIGHMVKDLVDKGKLEGHTFPSVEDKIAELRPKMPASTEWGIKREAEVSANILRMDSDVIAQYLPKGESPEDALEMWAKENDYDGIEELADPDAAEEPASV